MAAIECSPAGEIATAVYLRYGSVEELEAQFDALLENYGAVPAGTDCSMGPSLAEYTIDGQTAGRLACYQANGQTVVQWTNRDLLLIGMGSDESADFASMYAWWQGAGPLP